MAIGALQNCIIPSRDEKWYKKSMVSIATTSFDHRVVDGVVGAQWLATFKSHVKIPSTLKIAPMTGQTTVAYSNKINLSSMIG